MIVGNFQCAVQELPEINRFAHNLFGGGGLSGLKKIPAADLNGRKAYGSRGSIHVSLHGEQALRRSQSAQGAMRRRRCSDRLPPATNTPPVLLGTNIKRPP